MKHRDFINKLELRGRVGSASILTIADKKCVRFTLATNEIFRGEDGRIQTETTWHNIIAWEGRDVADLETVKLGEWVHLKGRLRNKTYVDAATGNTHYVTEVVATWLQLEPEV